MQTVNALWAELLALPGTEREYAFTVGGVPVDREDEIRHGVEQSLFPAPALGRASAAKLTLSLFASEIPPGAEIRRRVRLRNGDRVSGWLPAGVFSVARRSRDGDRWEITAFDALHRADAVWEPDPALLFPLSMGDAAADCAAQLGTELDPRCEFLPYTLPRPAGETVREILAAVGAAHGGNWTVSPAGYLRLVPLAGPEGAAVTDVGLEVTGFSDRGAFPPVGRVTLVCADGTEFSAGEDGGLALRADCPGATAAMAAETLRRVSGLRYRAFNAKSAALDPAAEPGDWVRVCGLTGMLGEISDRGNGFPDIAAPGEPEEDEAVGPATRVFDRRLSETRERLEQTAAAILAEMEEQVSDLAQSVSESLDEWTYPGTGYIDGRKLMNGTVKAGTLAGASVPLLDGNAAEAGSLTLSGASGGGAARIELRSGALELQADRGEVYLRGPSGTALQIGSFLRCEGSVAPARSGVHSCGKSGAAWTDVWADNSVIQVSDLRRKEDVSYDLTPYGDFYDRLAPMRFRFSEGQSGRRHVGLGAQDVEAALAASGLSGADFAGFVKDVRETEDGETRADYALRYGEFIPLNIWQIQVLKRRVAALEETVARLTGERT